LHHTNSSITLATDFSIHRFVSKIISTHTLSHNILLNASNCMDIANSNAQNAIAILNQTYTKEIADRNHRVTSFSKALYILE
jgi:hypothetical protein